MCRTIGEFLLHDREHKCRLDEIIEETLKRMPVARVGREADREIGGMPGRNEIVPQMIPATDRLEIKATP